MSLFKISLDKSESQTAYLPGDEVKGRVSGSSGPSDKAEKFTVNLMWQTRGKGTVDTKVVASADFTAAGIADGGRFSFRIPDDGPYSLAGRLLSIMWQVELRASKRKEVLASASFIVSPTGQEIAISEVPREIEARGAIRPA